jgi:carbonic anhydrase
MGYFKFSIATLCAILITHYAKSLFDMKNHYWKNNQPITPEQSLAFLKAGNERFLKNLRINRNLLQLVNETAEQQYPFAAILSCSDSRISPELIFDQGLGDIFSIRLAGNIASENAIGSMEYACKYLGSKLIVVMGHTGCGAVKGACADFELDCLNDLLDHIRLAVHHETETLTNRNADNKTFVNNVSRLNVIHNIEVIMRRSTILRVMVESNEVDIIGAMYSIETGKVTFLDSETLLEKKHVLQKHTLVLN